ncbi:CLAVATA3/ESR-RELATED [Trema orientale]|uniref:CLAVATA3/ESR-RELATED n=1 Tax=Trema orientale TaxID=63057 RepID=A0A2P5F704_TREOI|nr:CLAVATA3/ESR-RELATED [Trema orientale]
MGLLANRVALLLLLLSVGFLALLPENTSALRSKDLALKWDKGKLPFLGNLHIFKAVALGDLERKLDLAPAPSVTFDPNQSNKRRVRRGSDPIHNRC